MSRRKFNNPDTPPILTNHPAFTLENLNSQRERTLSSQLAWGAAFGTALFSAQTLIYYFFAKLSLYIFPKEDNTLLRQFNFLNLFQNSTMLDTRTGITISHLIYLIMATSIFSLVNVAHNFYYSRKKPSDLIDEETFLENEKPHNINHLYHVVVKEDQLALSWLQIGIIGLISLLFIAPNLAYCSTFLDIGGGRDTIKLLPDYGLSFYKSLNQKAGWVGTISNIVLNQWFAFFSISLTLMHSYNKLLLTRKHFKREGRAAKSSVAATLFFTLLISNIGTLGFYYLSKNDPHLIEKSPILQYLIPISSFIVYGLVLNTIGSTYIIHDIKKLWSLLLTMPQPLYQAHNRLKQYHAHILGYFAWNIRESFRELAFYFGYSNYTRNHDLDLPHSHPNESYLPLNEETAGQKYSLRKLKRRVDKKIANLETSSIISDTEKLLLSLIIEERNQLDKKIHRSPSKTDIWRNGRLRKLPKNLFILSGPVGMSITLTGYFLLVQNQVSLKFNLDPVCASSLEIGFALFFSFLYMVYNESYDAMETKFIGIEETISQAFHSLQVLFRFKKSSDFTYFNRLHPVSKKEGIQFFINTVTFVVQLTALLTTGPSSASAIYLLDKYNFLTPITKHTSFWFTAIFNSIGFESFARAGKDKIDKAIDGPKKSTLYALNNRFFSSITSLPSCRFDINELKNTALRAA